MNDITDIFREMIHPAVREILLLDANLFGKINIMNSRIVHCNSLEELTINYEEIKPCYAYIHRVRFRESQKAYEEITGEILRGSREKRAFIIQDRYGTKWCWGNDRSSKWNSTINKDFSDYEILDFVFGKVIFGATFSGPIRTIDVFGYGGRATKSQSQKNEAMNISPAYASAIKSFF
jgi:hypothetical protein